MNCPACLTFGLTTEATVQVEGTMYCGPHGVEAYSQIGQRGPRRAQRFSAPTPTVPVTPPDPA